MQSTFRLILHAAGIMNANRRWARTNPEEKTMKHFMKLVADFAVLTARVASAAEYRATNFLPPVHPVTIESFDNWATDIARLSCD